MKESMLTKKEKQIINLVISLATGCQPCTKYYVKKCIGVGMTENEINEVLEQTEQITTQAIQNMKRRVMAMLNINNNDGIEFHVKCKNRNGILVGIAVSYTKNNTDLLDIYLTHAENIGISSEEISHIIEISLFIYSKAKAHVDILRESRGIENKINKTMNCSPGCGC